MKFNQPLFLRVSRCSMKFHPGFIALFILILISCRTSSPEKHWSDQQQQCIAQQTLLKKTPEGVAEYCRQWESPLQRAQWLEKNQGDPTLILENYLKHLKRVPDSQNAKKLLVQARVKYVDHLVKEMDSAIKQNDPMRIWKLARDFQRIEKLLKDYAPIPEMLSHYIRDTPEINLALKTVEAEFKKQFEESQPPVVAKPVEERGRFYVGFRSVLVVFCQNNTGFCHERYRIPGGIEE